jgi:hypothetical protein
MDLSPPTSSFKKFSRVTFFWSKINDRRIHSNENFQSTEWGFREMQDVKGNLFHVSAPRNDDFPAPDANRKQKTIKLSPAGRYKHRGD